MHNFGDFFRFLSDAEHNAGFCGKAFRFGVFEDPEGAIVAGGFSDGALEAFDGLHVVVENVGFCVEDDVHELGFSTEVWDKNFDSGLWVLVADGADGCGPDGSTAVFEVIAGDGGDDGVFEAHFFDGLGDSGGFAEIEFCGAAGLDGAECAGAGANITEDHQGCSAAGPAFSHVRALSALADGVEVIRIYEGADFFVLWAVRKFCAEPIGFFVMIHDV